MGRQRHGLWLKWCCFDLPRSIFLPDSSVISILIMVLLNSDITMCLKNDTTINDSTPLSLTNCPKLCECKWKNGKETVACIGANFREIPKSLDHGTQVLDLTGNSLQFIPKECFRKVGLLNLQKLYMVKCKLKSIDKDAFNLLTNLVELDLSNNNLQSIPSHTFHAVPELRELRLNGNPIQRLTNNAFTLVPQLVKLELSECRIATVEGRALSALSSLEFLKLDGNHIATLPKSTLYSLRALHGLVLHNNPWNCSCELRALREWMLKKNVPISIPPVCATPKRVENQSWDKLDLDDYACPPNIVLTDHTAQTHGKQGDNVTLTCHVNGIPEPFISWMWNNRVLANVSTVSYKRQTYIIRESGRFEKVSNLTVTMVDLQDAGVYTCAAENRAGRVESNVTLTITRKLVSHNTLNRVLIIGILVAGLLILATCFLLACMCHVKQRQRRQEQTEDNYDKIEMNHKPVMTNHVNSRNRREDNHKSRGAYQSVPTAETENGIENAQEKIWLVKNELTKEDTELTLDSSDLNQTSVPSETGSDIFLKHTEDIPKVTLLFEKRNRATNDITPLSDATTLSLFPTVAESNKNDVTVLPKKKPQPAPRVAQNHRRGASESQSPLLPGSRSSGEGSNSSVRDNNDHAWTIYNPYRHSSTNSMNVIPHEQLNASKEYHLPGLRRNPSLPTSPLQHTREEEWNLYDESRPRHNSSSSQYQKPTRTRNSYDYHATQLEKFLEEYRNLQEQLWKMKETCESLQVDYKPNSNTRLPGSDPMVFEERFPMARPEPPPYVKGAYSQFSSATSNIERRNSDDFFPE